MRGWPSLRILPVLVVMAALLSLAQLAVASDPHNGPEFLEHLHGHAGSQAFAVNEAGSVVGRSFDDLGNTTAALWADGASATGLGTLGGDFSEAFDINELDQVVGRADQEGVAHYFLWDEEEGIRTLAEAPPAEGKWFEALSPLIFHRFIGINTSGHIAGTSDQGGFLWTGPGEVHMLLGLTENAEVHAVGINDHGQVVGNSMPELVVGPLEESNTDETDTSASAGAVLWDPDDLENPQALGLMPGGGVSWATALNNSGQVVGYGEVEGGAFHPFFWDPEEGMQDLGTLGGNEAYAFGINDFGQVVGISLDGEDAWRAFIWTEEQGMQSLGSVACVLLAAVKNGLPGNSGCSGAVDINNQGQVVGWAANESAEIQAARWTIATPQVTIDTISDDVQGLVDGEVLTQGQGNALLSSLDAAASQQERGNANAAERQLGAFINQVEAYVRSGRLTEEEGASLIAGAEAVRDELND